MKNMKTDGLPIVLIDQSIMTWAIINVSSLKQIHSWNQPIMYLMIKQCKGVIDIWRFSNVDFVQYRNVYMLEE